MNRRWMAAAALALTLLPATVTRAAVDFFLEIDGIEGESADERHKGAIDVQSWSWGASNPVVVGGGGGGTGKVSFSDLSISKSLDKSSPLLVLACAQGKHIKSAKLTCRKSDAAGGPGNEFYVITLTDILVSSVSASGSTGDGRPSESLSLNFTKIEWTYVPVDATGAQQPPVHAGWDVAQNVEIP